MADRNDTPDEVTVPCEGGEMTMFVWTPAAGHGPGIVLIQEIFGVGDYIRDVAVRLADAGYVVGAPDVFWRFAPRWAATNDDAGMAASFEQVGKLDRDVAVADCVAALHTLGGLGAVDGTPGVLGFCLGGTLSWAVALAAEPAVCVSYYGSGVPAMIDSIDAATCPTLFHFGRDDDFIPAEGVERLNTAISGKSNMTLNVEVAGHAFDNHCSERFYAEGAAQAAWAKTMAFLGQHLPV
ncbi:MAG TPA: dienelactone hydrolase family protein [Ilumatobacter sp.]|nr:dienelactone hydrolase family protein [Ilumatobacter sp.]